MYPEVASMKYIADECNTIATDLQLMLSEYLAAQPPIRLYHIARQFYHILSHFIGLQYRRHFCDAKAWGDLSFSTPATVLSQIPHLRESREWGADRLGARVGCIRFVNSAS